MERVCRHYTEDFGYTRVVRFHNIFGPLGTYAAAEKSQPLFVEKIAL